MGKDPPDKYITKKICLEKIIRKEKLLKLSKFIYNTNDLTPDTTEIGIISSDNVSFLQIT